MALETILGTHVDVNDFIHYLCEYKNFPYPFAGTFLDRKIGFRSRESNPGPFKAERLR